MVKFNKIKKFLDKKLFSSYNHLVTTLKKNSNLKIYQKRALVCCEWVGRVKTKALWSGF